MLIEKPTYVVAELPNELSEWVEGVRQRFEPATAHMPAEITLAGSSGVGPIREGQNLTSIAREVERVTRGKTDFTFKLLGVSNFEGTDIFFLKPERAGFDTLHTALKTSEIIFHKIPYPFNPHCSLKGFTPLVSGQREGLEALDVPQSEFQIECISVYEMDGMQPRKLLSIPR